MDVEEKAAPVPAGVGAVEEATGGPAPAS
jgi:hypothetical protein